MEQMILILLQWREVFNIQMGEGRQGNSHVIEGSCVEMK